MANKGLGRVWSGCGKDWVAYWVRIEKGIHLVDHISVLLYPINLIKS